MLTATDAIALGLPDVITNAADLSAAVFDARIVGVPFQIEATIIAPNSESDRTFAIEDESGTMILEIISRRSGDIVASGDRVRVSGVTAEMVSGHVLADCRQIVTLAHGEPVPPIPTTAQDVLAGKCDCRLVQITGIITDAFRDEVDPKFVYVVIICDGEVIYTSIKSYRGTGEELRAMVGAKASIVGLCHPLSEGGRRHIGRLLRNHGIESIKILQPPTGDIFSVPELGSYLKLRPLEISKLGRRKTVGWVTAVWRGDCAMIETDAGRVVQVCFAGETIPRYGMHVEVVGLPETDLYRINLTRAIWREIPANSIFHLRQDRAVTADELLKDSLGRVRINNEYHGRGIVLEGEVISLPGIGSNSGTFYIKNGSSVVPVEVSSMPQTLDGLMVGFFVRVRGTCVMDIENWRPNSVFPRIKGFTLVMRTPSDLEVLRQPSWWTPIRLVLVIVGLLMALASIFVWNLALRKAASRKGRQLLREQLGHVKADLKAEERTRLAVELHDSLAQSLTGVSMEIETARELGETAPSDMMTHLGFAARALKSCRDELRNCLWDLRSQALEERDLNKAILRTLQPQVNDSRLAVKFMVPRNRLSDNLTHALLCMIRELVINAVRHGEASLIRVAGSIDVDGVKCSVADNGCGFDPDNCPGVLQGHFGLVGIQERVEQLRGAVSIVSAPGSGAKVTIVIPLENEESA